jgi:hypothetical protein
MQNTTSAYKWISQGVKTMFTCAQDVLRYLAENNMVIMPERFINLHEGEPIPGLFNSDRQAMYELLVSMNIAPHTFDND